MIQKSPEKNRKNPLKPAKNRLKIFKIDYNFRSIFFISDNDEAPVGQQARPNYRARTGIAFGRQNHGHCANKVHKRGQTARRYA